MAQINIGVKLDTTVAQKNLEALSKGIVSIGKSLSTVKVDKGLSSALNELTKQYKALADAAKSVSAANNKQAIDEARLTAATQKATAATINAQTAKVKLIAAEQRLETQIKKSTVAQKEHNSTVDKGTQSILSMMKGFASWQLSATVVMKTVNTLRSAFTSLNETLVTTEDTVISLQRVLNEDLANSQISTRLYELAQEYGQTFENVSEISLNFARTGKTWAETLKATEAAVLALNVAELTASEASDGMIAIMTQFKIGADELLNVVDALNKTADNFPVTTEKILTALQRTGSSAANANLSLAETVGLITALSESTGRSGPNLGTALNSLIQYSSKDSALNTFAAVSDNMAAVVAEYKKGAASILDVWENLSVEINRMTDQQADVLDAYFDTEEGSQLAQELGNELGDIYEDLSGVYSTANTFRKNYFIALLKDMKTVREAQEVAENAQGYSQEENLQYLDTYTAKVNSLKAQWQELANDEQGFLGFKKGLVDMGSAALTLVKNIGGIKTILGLMTSAAVAIYGPQAIQRLKTLGTGIASWAKNLISYRAAQEAANAASQKATELEAIKIKQQKYAAMGLVSEATAERAATAASEAHTAAMEAEAAAAKARNTAVAGWVGIAIAVVTTAIGLISKYNKEQEAARETAISTWEANKENAQQLNQLVTAYQNMDKTNSDYLSTEEQIVNLLGDKAAYLQNVTKGTDEYRQAVLALSAAQKAEYAAELSQAYGAAEYALLDMDVPRNTAGVTNSKSVISRLDDYHLIQRKFKVLDNDRRRLAITGDIAAADKIKNSKEYSNYAKFLTENRAVVENYLESTTDYYLNDYVQYRGQIDTKQKAREAAKYISSQAGLFGAYLDEIEAEILKLVELPDNQKSGSKMNGRASVKTLETQQSLYSQILDDINAAVDAQKEQNDLLEKQLAITEAQEKVTEKELALEEAKKNLETARQQRTVRVYNATTGLFEWQANKKTVQSAEDDVAKAEQDLLSAQESVNKTVESLNEFLQKKALEEIKAVLSDGNAHTAAEIQAIIDKWSAESPVEGTPEFANLLSTAFSDALRNNGIIDKIVDPLQAMIAEWKLARAGGDEVESTVISARDYGGGTAPYGLKRRELYDDGGILDGLGGIKATSSPEAVINPELTAKVLKPRSSAQFKAFAEGLNLMFAATEKAQTGRAAQVISNVTGGTTNNSSYTVNGVPISNDAAERYTIKELFNNMDLVRTR